MRVAVLGCSGYLGSLLVESLLRTDGVELVVGVGRRHGPPTDANGSRFRYVAGDLLELPLEQLFADHGIDRLVHLVFISRPTRDEHRAYATNVLCAARAFEAASAAGVRSGVLVSSVAVYGPRQRAAPATEADAPWPNNFQFSRHKVLQELVAHEHAMRDGFGLAIVRPCTVVGPRCDNFVVGSLRRGIVLLPSRVDAHWQFLHEEDFCRAVVAIVVDGATGVFNVVPDDSIPLREAVRTLGARPVSLPVSLLRAAASAGWNGRLGALVPAPASAVAYLRDGPVASNAALRAQLGIAIEHSSREALEAALR